MRVLSWLRLRPEAGEVGTGGFYGTRYTSTLQYYSTLGVEGEVFCKIKTLRGLFAMFRSQSDSKIQI